MTIAKLYKIMAGASGHNVVAGTPADVADVMQDWFENGACDGWNLIPPYLPGPAIECLEWLVPELQRRGLAQTSYQGDGTLRGSLGVERPSFRSRGKSATFGRITTPADVTLESQSA
jgi:alkanesulfonate monooxygenase